MNKNEKYVITINRELGSGGRTVGQKLAEKLGVQFYDKAVIKGLQEKYHLTVEEIEKLKGRRHDWWAEFKYQLLNPSAKSTNLYLPRTDYEAQQPDTDAVFKAETEILNGIIADESCVVAGRSGFYIFRNHPNCLSILIQASIPFRIERLMRKQHLTEEEARDTIDKIDNMRENYVKKYTGTSRYDTRNYNLVITADHKSEDEIVDLILKYIG
jgi:cytidylate kinase